ncbi:hypothetical protein ACHAXA_009745 [Cyclostephanos tholiformis]|uniref:Uncharacterized protein n=1 Tax=Cyclostephanos tholiformis TaxID=382380 RepID=A0ABD3R993_9STRA
MPPSNASRMVIAILALLSSCNDRIKVAVVGAFVPNGNIPVDRRISRPRGIPDYARRDVVSAVAVVADPRRTASYVTRSYVVSFPALAATTTTTTTTTTTLTEDTTWRLRLLLRDVATTAGRRLDGGAALFVVEGNFIEEEGYEPPRGYFRPISTTTTTTTMAAGGEGGGGEEAITATVGGTTTLEVVESRWKLSEDPDDPKDGLWIWGLFKEPLYPYMLLQMETREMKLPRSVDGVNDDSIPALKLYARVPHVRKRDDENGGVELRNANLNVRVLERINLPGTSVDLYEEEAVGQISFQPLL